MASDVLPTLYTSQASVNPNSQSATADVTLNDNILPNASYLVVVFAEWIGDPVHISGPISSLTITDDTGQNNTYTVVDQTFDSLATIGAMVAYGRQVKGLTSTSTVTVHFGGVSVTCAVHVICYERLSDWLLDGHAALTSTSGGTVSSGSFNTSKDGAIVLGFTATHGSAGDTSPDGNVDAGSGFTGLLGTGAATTASSEHKMAGTAGAVAATFGTNTGNRASVFGVAFRPYGYAFNSSANLNDSTLGGDEIVSNTATIALTLDGGAVTPGNTVVVTAGVNASVPNAVPVITDDATGATNTYVVVQHAVSTSGPDTVWCAYGTNIQGSPTTITITIPIDPPGALIAKAEEIAGNWKFKASNVTAGSVSSDPAALPSALTPVANGALFYVSSWAPNGDSDVVKLAGGAHFNVASWNNVISPRSYIQAAAAPLTPSFANTVGELLLFGMLFEPVSSGGKTSNQIKGVRVVANASSKTLRTVKIVTSPVAGSATWAQMTAAQVAADPRELETVQDGTAAATAGTKTVYISGYAAPD